MTMAGERSCFSKGSVVRGHHVYKHIRTPEIGEELSVKKEPGNFHDDFAVFVVFQAELILRQHPLTALDTSPAII